MESTVVLYGNHSWVVKGYWIPFRAATLEEPQEGDCFDEWDILILNESIYEELNDKTIERITTIAEEQLREEMSGE